MVGTAFEFFRRHSGWVVFVISLLYSTLKEQLKIQGHHPFELGFGFSDVRCGVPLFIVIPVMYKYKNR